MKKKILIVEDDAIAVLVATRLLEALDCQVDCATDGQQAVELACQHRYDGIYMDIGLPKLNGIDTCRAIRHYEATKSKPQRAVVIIAVTANNDSAEISNYLQVGMNQVLFKPFTTAKAQAFLAHCQQ